MSAVTGERLTEDLRRLGLRPGAIAMVHTRMSALGWVIGGSEAAHDHGRIPERVRTWPGAKRSVHPEASVVAVGARAEWLCAEHLFPARELLDFAVAWMEARFA